MKRLIIFCLSLSLLTASGALAQEEMEAPVNPEYQNISYDRYRTGALVGTIAGFGFGHRIQKRYDEDNGKIFMLGEAAPIVLLVGSTFLFSLGGDDTPNCTSGEAIRNPDKCPRRSNALASEGALGLYLATFIGFKIWETIDVWSYDYNAKSPKTTNQPSASLMLLPMGADKLGALFTYEF